MLRLNLNKSLFHVRHFPTWMLTIGYVIFWLELYVIRGDKGSTSFLAMFAAIAAGLLVFWQTREAMRTSLQLLLEQWNKWDSKRKVYNVTLLAGVLGVTVIAFQASLLPLHLLPELDALKYHYAIPRQHLIRHDFSHLSWSSGDLFLLPLQFALSPYWFSTELPNKIPQFALMLGLLGVCGSIGNRLRGDQKSGVTAASLTVAALAGSHGLSIQYGTAMLDIPVTYLFLATVDSLMARRPATAALEFSFYVWSKPFIPVQTLLMVLITAILVFLARRYKWSFNWGFCPNGEAPTISYPLLKKAILFFTLTSLPIVLPFTVKSFYYAGTPLYPFGVGPIAPLSPEMKNRRDDLQRTATGHLNIRDSYGRGRSFKEFVVHLWCIAVPTRGVNNEYDYPLGLPYLIFGGPFLFFLLRAFKRRELALLPTMGVIFWASWWMGSQQARWLYIPLCLVVVCTSALPSVWASIGVKGALLLSLALTMLSLVRAHRADWGRSTWDVLRSQDKALIEMGRSDNHDRQGPVLVNARETAFAEFEVTLKNDWDEWILTR